MGALILTLTALNLPFLLLVAYSLEQSLHPWCCERCFDLGGTIIERPRWLVRWVNRWQSRKPGEKWRASCQWLKILPRVQVMGCAYEDSRSLAENAYVPYLCRGCAREWHEEWDERWSEYHGGSGVGCGEIKTTDDDLRVVPGLLAQWRRWMGIRDVTPALDREQLAKIDLNPDTF